VYRSRSKVICQSDYGISFDVNSLIAVIIAVIILNIKKVILTSQSIYSHFTITQIKSTTVLLIIYQADVGIGKAEVGTSVATDTCGQESPLKFSITV
jgi:hypothetical protein